MSKNYYKFICDSCGIFRSEYGFCKECLIPLTMYNSRVTEPHPVRYVR